MLARLAPLRNSISTLAPLCALGALSTVAACTVGTIDPGGVFGPGAGEAPSSATSGAADPPRAAADAGKASPSSDAAPSTDAGPAAPPGSDAGPTDPPPPPSSDAAPPPSADDAAIASAATYVRHQVTFYGWPDNSPPGPAISRPTLHTVAGGVGTYEDPITFASALAEWPPGTLLYVPVIQKYVIMEDTCTRCTTDWASGKHHIDVWMNGDGTNDAALLDCENSWTRPDVDVEIHPPAGRPVSVAPLFDPVTAVCRPTP